MKNSKWEYFIQVSQQNTNLDFKFKSHVTVKKKLNLKKIIIQKLF